MIFTKNQLRLLYFKAKDEDEKKTFSWEHWKKKIFYFLKFAENY